MKLFKFLTIIVMALLLTSACATKSSGSEFSFANRLASKGLWKEALVRWQRIAESGRESAALYNNIAVALEQQGRPEEAEKAYEKALKLAPGSDKIQSNLNRLKKFLGKGEPGKDDKLDGKRKKRKKGKRKK